MAAPRRLDQRRDDLSAGGLVNVDRRLHRLCRERLSDLVLTFGLLK
jgi:hypothetical protein